LTEDGNEWIFHASATFDSEDLDLRGGKIVRDCMKLHNEELYKFLLHHIIIIIIIIIIDGTTV